MKVLFVGEGNNDIGRSFGGIELQKATGVVPTLCRLMRPHIDDDSVAVSWKQIRLHCRTKALPGYDRKLKLAVELAIENGCTGTIAVVDEDNKPQRRSVLSEARNAIASDEETKLHRVAIGVAVKSLEAWTLADHEAIASVIGCAPECDGYRPAQVEHLYQESDKPLKRPKDLLKRVLELGHLEDSTDIRVDIAKQSNIETLKRHCPTGFKPFAEEVCERFPLANVAGDNPN